MMHMVPFTCHVFITTAAIFVHPRSVIVTSVCSLPLEPAVPCRHALCEWRWLGARLGACSVDGTRVYLWLHFHDLVLFVCQ